MATNPANQTAKERKNDPRSWFLVPSNRTYPYKIGGKVSCKLLHAAIARGNAAKNRAVVRRAQALMKKHKCYD